MRSQFIQYKQIFVSAVGTNDDNVDEEQTIFTTEGNQILYVYIHTRGC